MRGKRKGRGARHIIVIAGVSSSGKTELIRKLSQKSHDKFNSLILKEIGCETHQDLKRSTIERVQRLMEPENFKKRKTRKLRKCLLLHIDLTSINYKKNLKLLREISKRSKRVDAITLYTNPKEWRLRIYARLHTENEPSMRAALIALLGRVSVKISDALYHREYKKWSSQLKSINPKGSAMVNTFEEKILSSIPPQPAERSLQAIKK